MTAEHDEDDRVHLFEEYRAACELVTRLEVERASLDPADACRNELGQRIRDAEAQRDRLRARLLKRGTAPT